MLSVTVTGVSYVSNCIQVYRFIAYLITDVRSARSRPGPACAPISTHFNAKFIVVSRNAPNTKPTTLGFALETRTPQLLGTGQAVLSKMFDSEWGCTWYLAIFFRAVDLSDLPSEAAASLRGFCHLQ